MMPAYKAHRTLARRAPAVFDLIGTHVYENHPRWEKEVIEIKPASTAPVAVGSRAVMVREEYGRRSETTYEVTELIPDRKIAFRHVDGSMGFELAFLLSPASTETTDLDVHVRMQPRGALRLLTPLLARSLPKRTERITSDMVRFVESQPEHD
jgi:hypothetical protein